MKYVLVLIVGLVLGIGATVLAATKSATLTPPADHTAQGWSICLAPTAVVGTYTLTVNACAKDAVTGISDCEVQSISGSGVSIDAFADARLAAWRTAFGY